MSQALRISDELYTKLARAAANDGVPSIEILLENWNCRAEEIKRRTDAVKQIDAVRTHLQQIYGEMPDSVPLLHEDRAR